MKNKLLLLAAVVVASLALMACDKKEEKTAEVPYNYINAESVAKIIRDNDQEYAIIDIQLEDKFDEHHLRGAIPTYAFPGDKPEMQAKLKAGLEQVKDNQKIIIVCPRGGGGAKNTVNYYRGLGVDNDRLLILESGQDGWPADVVDVMVEGK